MDGLEFIKKLRSSDDIREIPVIAITASYVLSDNATRWEGKIIKQKQGKYRYSIFNANKLAGLLGGKTELESEEGKGSASVEKMKH